MKIKLKNYLFILILSFSLFFTGITEVFANNFSYSEIIAPGLVRKKYDVNVGKGNTVVNVLECDLTNPLLKIEVVAGKGKYNQRATVSQMAKRTDATAMVNGDFFNMLLQGTPEGPSIVNNKLESSPCVMTGVYSLGIDDNNTAHIEQIKFNGSVTAPNGNSYPIDGLNKSYYWYEPNGEYSHQNKIQLYNDFWAASTRGDKKNTEILINGNGVIENISLDKSFPFPVPDGKIIMQVDGTAKNFILSNTKIGDTLKINYDINPNRKWKFLIGGHALLVDNGQTLPYTKDINVLGGTRARTCAGISKDGKKLYIASAEARTSRSVGMSLPNLSKFMQSIGCYRAVNLDGGGSTAMVVKNLGEFNHTRVINPERNSSERPVVNGIGFYNMAKETGPAISVKVNGPDDMIVGQKADFTIKGAWDANYKPVDPNTMTYDLKDSFNDKAAWNNTTFTARNPGSVTITLTTNTGATGSKVVNVHDFSYIDKLYVSTDKNIVKPNDKVKITVKAKLKNNITVELSPEVLKYSISGFSGNFENDNLTISSLNNSNVGVITVQAGNLKSSTNLLDSNAKIITMKINSKNYSINNDKKTMDAAPFIKNSRTMVPIRFIMDAFNGETSWDDKTKTVFIKYNGNEIQIPVNKNIIKVNGSDIKIDSPAIIKDNRTFVPVRFIVENFGMNIEFKDKTREVVIMENITPVSNTNTQTDTQNSNFDTVNNSDDKNINNSNNLNNNINQQDNKNTQNNTVVKVIS